MGRGRKKQVNVVKKGKMLGPVFAPDISNRMTLGIRAQTLVPILLPEAQGVAAVREVRLHRPWPNFCSNSNCLFFFFFNVDVDVDGEALVVATGGSFQVVQTGESCRGHGVELAEDALAGAWEVEQEGNTVGTAYQWVGPRRLE